MKPYWTIVYSCKRKEKSTEPLDRIMMRCWPSAETPHRTYVPSPRVPRADREAHRPRGFSRSRLDLSISPRPECQSREIRHDDNCNVPLLQPSPAATQKGWIGAAHNPRSNGKFPTSTMPIPTIAIPPRTPSPVEEDDIVGLDTPRFSSPRKPLSPTGLSPFNPFPVQDDRDTGVNESAPGPFNFKPTTYTVGRPPGLSQKGVGSLSALFRRDNSNFATRTWDAVEVTNMLEVVCHIRSSSHQHLKHPYDYQRPYRFLHSRNSELA